MDEKSEAEVMKVINFFDGEEDLWESANKHPGPEGLARYQEKTFLAAGGMKEVYQVYDAKTRRYVAMAQLKKDGPPRHCEAFLEEAYLTASLVHPNIISVYNVGLDDDEAPYFIMELKIGNTLGGLAFGGADKLQLLEIFLKVCDAVSHAHSVGILHLDIKPDNIQVGEHGLVKLCDWGLACRVSELDDQPDVIRGTPGYMSPEQVHREKLGYYSDVYSLGALLCFILTGEAPFDGGVKTMMDNTVNGDLKSFTRQAMEIEISDSLEAVVKRAMATDPEDRYLSVDDLKADVTNFLSGYSTNAENAGLLKECILFYRRNRASCWVASALIITLALTVAGFFRNLSKSKSRIEQSLEKLEEAHIRLQNAKKNEKEAQEKYIAQRVARIRANMELQERNLEDAFSSVVYPRYFTDPVGAIDKSLRIFKRHLGEDDDGDIAQNIIICLFISQQFEEIRDYPATFTLPLVEIAEECADLRKTFSGVLAPNHFVELLQTLNKRLLKDHKELLDSVFERMVYYHHAKTKEPHIDRRIIIGLLKSMNPGWKVKRFDFRSKQRRLTISGEALKYTRGKSEYSSRKCILNLMNLRALVLRKTGISEPSQLDGLKTDRVDISGSRIRTIDPPSAFRGISVLIISENQIPVEMLSQALPGLRIQLLGTSRD